MSTPQDTTTPAAPALTKHDILVPCSVDDEFLAGIITTAVEGGIGYWSLVTQYHFKYSSEEDGFLNFAEVTVHEEADSDYEGPTIRGGIDSRYKKEGVHVTMEKVLAVLRRICDPAETMSLHKDYRDGIRSAVMQADCGMLDSSDCDNIIQLVVLNDIVYG